MTRIVRRLLVYGIGVPVALALIAFAAGWMALRASLPRHRGRGDARGPFVPGHH